MVSLSLFLIVSAMELVLDVVQERGVVAAAQCHFECIDDFAKVVVFVEDGPDVGIELLDFSLETGGDDELLILQVLDQVLELLEMALLAISECALCGSVLLLAKGGFCRGEFFAWAFGGLAVGRLGFLLRVLCSILFEIAERGIRVFVECHGSR